MTNKKILKHHEKSVNNAFKTGNFVGTMQDLLHSYERTSDDEVKAKLRDLMWRIAKYYTSQSIINIFGRKVFKILNGYKNMEG